MVEPSLVAGILLSFCDSLFRLSDLVFEISKQHRKWSCSTDLLGLRRKTNILLAVRQPRHAMTVNIISTHYLQHPSTSCNSLSELEGVGPYLDCWVRLGQATKSSQAGPRNQPFKPTSTPPAIQSQRFDSAACFWTGKKLVGQETGEEVIRKPLSLHGG